MSPAVRSLGYGQSPGTGIPACAPFYLLSVLDSDFEDSDFEDSDFEDSDLADSDFEDSDFELSDFDDSLFDSDFPFEPLAPELLPLCP